MTGTVAAASPQLSIRVDRRISVPRRGKDLAQTVQRKLIIKL
jgi:hypothetical protein